MTEKRPADPCVDLLPKDGRFGSGPSKVRSRSTTSPRSAPRSWHLAPRGPGQEPRRRGPRGDQRLFSLPDGYEVVLGNGEVYPHSGTSPPSAWSASAQHLAFGEFSSKFASVTNNALPRRIHHHQGRPRLVGRAAGRGRRRCLRVAPQRDVDGCHGARQAGEGCRRGRARAHRRHLGRGRPAGRRGRVRRLLLRPAKCFAADGGLWLAAFSPAALARVDEIAATGRGSRTSSPPRPSTTRARTRPTTRPGGHPRPAEGTAGVAERRAGWSGP